MGVGHVAIGRGGLHGPLFLIGLAPLVAAAATFLGTTRRRRAYRASAAGVRSLASHR